jgi:predicted HTH transcriptional regulator
LYENVENLLNDVGFWSKVILSTLKHPIEAQLWDFKETLAMWHTSGEEKARQVADFCENVAMFANSKGGVILIGVTDERPRRVIDVKNPEERIKHLSEVISKFCIYPKQFTTIHQVPMQGQSGTVLCLVVAIAQTKGVVSVVDNRGRYSYPRRSQTGILRVDQKSIELSKTEVLKDNYNFISELYKISYHGFISFSYE